MRAAVVFGLLAIGCGGEPEPTQSIRSVSQTGGTLSHKAHESCVSCHRPGGGTKEWFTAAGTVLWEGGTVQREGKVELNTAENGAGTMLASLEIDALGNFYTTEPLPLPDTELFPGILRSQTGKMVWMPFSTSSGSCNFCHLQNAGGRPTFKVAP